MPAGIGERLSEMAARALRKPAQPPPSKVAWAGMQATAAADRGRSWMLGGKLVKHPG